MTWMTGSLFRTNFEDIISKIKSLTNDSNHKVFIGTDSFRCGDVYVYTTAICLICKGHQNHSKYFYKKQKVKRTKGAGELSVRLFKETNDSVETANLIKSLVPGASIEIHLDVSRPNANQKTSKWASSLSGIVSGSGFDFKLKPHAIAASSVADKHTKAI